MRTSLRIIVALTLLAIGLARPAAAAEGARFAVVVEGASGEPQYASQHRLWVNALAGLLRDRMKLDANHLFVLTETPQDGELKSTAEIVRTVLDKVAKAAKPDDLVFVMLIGHGSGDLAAAKFNLVGPDLTAVEWNDLLKPISARLAIVDSTSSSFPFLAGLAGKNRIVITATNSYAQKYHTIFPEAFIRALVAPEADADKNGRISLLEAFTYASKLVPLEYERDNHMSTEIAVFDDTGDGKGRAAGAPGDDGLVAGLTYLELPATPTSSDPAVQQLLSRQQQLSDQVDDLRRRRPSMSADEFDKEFEKLIVDLSLVSRDVRRKMGK